MRYLLVLFLVTGVYAQSVINGEEIAGDPVGSRLGLGNGAINCRARTGEEVWCVVFGKRPAFNSCGGAQFRSFCRGPGDPWISAYSMRKYDRACTAHCLPVDGYDVACMAQLYMPDQFSFGPCDPSCVYTSAGE